MIDDRESPIPFILAIGAPRAGFFGLLSSRCTERAESFELRGAPCDVTKSKWNCGLSGELLNPKPSLMGRSGKATRATSSLLSCRALARALLPS